MKQQTKRKLWLSALPLLIALLATAQNYVTYNLSHCEGPVNIAITDPNPSGSPDYYPMPLGDTILIAYNANDTLVCARTGNIYDPLNPGDPTVYGYTFLFPNLPPGIYDLLLNGHPVTGSITIKSVPHINMVTPQATPGHPGLATCGPPVLVQVSIEDTAFQYVWKDVGDTTNVLIADASGIVYMGLNSAYKLSVITGHGCDVSSNDIYRVVNRRAFDQEICIVTTDPTSTHNIVVWDKDWLPERPSQYLIYRSGSLVGAVSADTFTLSEFRDTVNVDAQQYSYYIKTINICGDTSGLDFTTTEAAPIYIRNIEYNGQGGYCQIDWEKYSMGFSVNTDYAVYALDENATDWVLISQPDNINTFKDFNYVPGSKYQIRADLPACESERATYEAMSNIRSVTVTGIASIENMDIEIYPNPADNYLKLGGDYDSIEISNVTGQSVSEVKTQGHTLDISGLDSGIYFIKVKKGDSNIYTGKFFKH